ncbi:MAG: SDR family NAD(P)-dependent oxidoreductase [Bacillota bacterium]|nr:SDR family NAD(P)-dependent oxidoreductase [Bacillota bacterium]
MNKAILIAGCEGNVGKAAVAKFKANGWQVAGIDIKEKSTSDVDKYISVDIKDTEAVIAAADEIDAVMPIDAVFNAAGYVLDKAYEDTTVDEWQELLTTILGGAGNLCKAVAPKMVKRHEGKIILLSCDYAKQSDVAVVDAVAANTLHGFGKSFGVEMAPENVRVNVMYANTPLDIESVTETVFYLADKDTYTSAQVVAVTGEVF